MEMENEKETLQAAPQEAAAPAATQEEAASCQCDCACSCEEEKTADTPACEEAAECSCGCSCECEEEKAPEEAPAKERREQRPQIPVTQDMIDSSRETLVKMLDYLGLEGTVKAEGRTSKINLYVSSSDAGRIIGRKGQTLESLQIILNKLMQKTNADFPKVYIDLDGYSSGRTERNGDRRERGARGDRSSRRGNSEGRRGRDRRDDDFSSEDDNLRQQAIDASKEVRRWGEPVTLPPMNAHDRRIIHIALENEGDLVTESSGEGTMKSVTIMLKK